MLNSPIHFRLTVLWLISLSGCATYADRVSAIRTAYYAGHIDQASSMIDKHLAQKGEDADVLMLERAIVELTAGQPKRAERTLRAVRDRFDYLEERDVGESALSMVADENRISYAGEDYERVLIRAFLALANLMADGDDASAYALQIASKQQQIIQAGGLASDENPKLAYKRVALGAYIQGILKEESHSNFDDVERAIQQVANWEPDFPFAKQDLERARSGRHSDRGNGVLYVFALVGRGPQKQQVREEPTSMALLIADRVLSHTAAHTLPPTISSIKVPAVRLSDNEIENVNILVNGEMRGTTETITDIGELAVSQYEATRHHVLARAVVRRVVKKGIVYAGKDTLLQNDDPLVNFAIDAMGVAWEASEKADTRHWGLLPDKIQVLRLELPAGEHRISLQPKGQWPGAGATESSTLLIEDGRNSYLLASFPDRHLVGRILVSQSRH